MILERSLSAGSITDDRRRQHTRSITARSAPCSFATAAAVQSSVGRIAEWPCTLESSTTRATSVLEGSKAAAASSPTTPASETSEIAFSARGASADPMNLDSVLG